jgi:uncharacterized membrane protein YgcG
VFRRLGSVLALLLLLFPAAASAQGVNDVNNFTIKSFEADYYLSRDANKTSQLRVEERIVAEFPSFDQNHGIERAIPEEYQGHTVSLVIDYVRDQSGAALEFSSLHENKNLILRIGNKDKYVHGVTTYVIGYRLKNVINFQDQDEFYWDVNGDQWSQTFERVTARLHIEGDLVGLLTEDQSCFSGRYGINNQSGCSVERGGGVADVVISAKTLESLSGGQTLTIVVGFNKGSFVIGPEIAAEKRRLRNMIIAALTAVISPILGSIFFIIRRWRTQGRDPKSLNSVVPEYIPPKGLSVLDSELLLNERLRPQAITALMLDWAVKHYAVIEETKIKKIFKDKLEYTIKVVRDMSALPPEELAVARDLFGGEPVVGSAVKLNDLTNKLYKTVSESDKAVGESLAARQFYAQAPRDARKNFLKIGGLIVVVSFVGFFIPLLSFLTAGFFVGGILVMIFSGIMPKRTEEGVAAKQYLEGLKMYMKLAEKERLEFSQGLKTAERTLAGPVSDNDKIKLFERLLPYAILFGLDKDWAKEFAPLYSQPPQWYSGNIATFQGAAFANSLSSFSSTSQSAFMAPSSSGGSGFGGGGFSGGGGGGGGGGGW